MTPMATTKNTFPLMQLPIDIRLEILDNLLPRPKDGSKTISFHIRAYETSINGVEVKSPLALYPTPSNPSPLSIRRYLDGIGMVNRKLHQEALRLLYSRTFVLDIVENTFWTPATYPDIVTSRANEGVEWIWVPFNDWLPGLDWSRVTQLRVRLGDTDLAGYWQNAWNCLETFSKQRLGPLKHVQGLQLHVADRVVEYFDREDDMWLWLAEDGSLEPDPSTVEHLIECLRPFWSHWQGLAWCEIKVPEWASDDEGMQLAIEEAQEAVTREPTAREGDLEDEEPPVLDPARPFRQDKMSLEGLWDKHDDSDDDEWYDLAERHGPSCVVEMRESWD